MTTVYGRRVATSSNAIALVLSLLALLFYSGCSSDEENVAKFMQRGDGYQEAGQLQEAIIEYSNVLQIDPNSVEAHRKLANAYLESQQLNSGYWELGETIGF